MTNLVNIIHPYTLKLVEGTFMIGPVEEFSDRDHKLAEFLKRALDSGTRVLHQRSKHPSYVDGAMIDMAFVEDPVYELLFDPRVEFVVTTHFGCPIPDEKPLTISEETWSTFREYFTSHTQLGKVIGEPQNTFFLGGAFENCVANAAAYQNNKYRKAGQRLFYVSELCASFDSNLRRGMEEKLSELDIESITFQEAMGFF